MNVTIMSFVGCSNIFVVWYSMYNDPTSMVTKIKSTGTQNLFILLMKWFEMAGDGD